ncbi:hypothetical protein WICMUC_002477 [Wickerhamomyces mucosus]|uniref:UBL3-like ubiquitin domain-containing protein n=1 Tax=Wickerhamomyces mucosus TaxID=1378264 RepID=A0A9P8TEW4_9ASCO|nr:hypothetical protein WICMUC_002477 [Wickerhamomyces mucosus]
MPIRDIAYELPDLSITILLWSSDYINFQLENKLIKTTLNNTVLDIKELITIRSNKQQNELLLSPNLNPKCLKLIYRNKIFEDSAILKDIILNKFDDDPIRIQIEIDHSLIAFKDIKPSLIDINIRLASGKSRHYRESLNCTINSIKNSLLEDLNKSEYDLKSLNYLDSIELKDEIFTLGELLNMDLIPFNSQIQFHAKFINDFTIKLSSPNTSILRRNKVDVNFDTKIITIKQFIIDQYRGNYQINLEDIKIIYFGRILSNEILLNEIINVLPMESNPLTFHYIVNEREPQINNGFWSDFKNGNYFEFLPKEPNPNFDEDVRRDEISRQGLQSRINIEQIGESSTMGSQHEQQQPIELKDKISRLNSNKPPKLDAKHTGESYDSLVLNGQSIVVNQLKTSSFIIGITINSGSLLEKKVELSSSQAIINDSDPENPYIMLSPSGFAKLQTLGISIEPPNIIFEERIEQGTHSSIQEVNIPRQPTLIQSNNDFLRENLPNDNNINLNDGQNVNAEILNNQQNFANFNGPGVNIRLNFNAFQPSLFYLLGKLFLFYLFFLDKLPNYSYLKIFLTSFIIIYALASDEFRPIVTNVYENLSASTREKIRNLFNKLKNWIYPQDENLISGYYKLLKFSEFKTERNIIYNWIILIGLDISLFGLSFFPNHYRCFTQAQERRKSELEQLYNDNEEEQDQGNIFQNDRTLVEEDNGNIEDTIENLSDVEDDAFDEIREERGATGVQQYQE